VKKNKSFLINDPLAKRYFNENSTILYSRRCRIVQKNDQHKQGALFRTVSTLPQQVIKRLESSWAHAFYHSCFCKIDETVFDLLYSKKLSRPNVPVNILLVNDAYFDLRTIYNFRSALIAYEKKTGISLVSKATYAAVKEKMEAFQIKSGLLRNTDLIGARKF
jgi:hypothetical protein